MIGSRMAAAGVLAAFALVGCASTGGAGANGTSSPTSAEDMQVKFAECMRQHGVNVPDPKPGGRGGLTISGRVADKSKINTATAACRVYSPKAKAIDPDDPQVRDRMLNMAQCLRRHGINVSDPRPGQGLEFSKVDNARMRQALEACQKEVAPPATTSRPSGG